MKLLAIDPGLKGGLAVFDHTGILLATWRMPVGKLQYGGRGKKHRMIDLPEILRLIARYNIDTVVLEVPSAMPRQSSVATATSFANWGLLLSLAGIVNQHTSSVAEHYVYPGMWKKHYGLGTDKQDAIAHARGLLGLPLTDKLTDGEAEAALIGKYWINRGSERERASLQLQKSRPKRRKRKAKASALKRKAERPSASSPAPASAAAART